MVRRPQGFKFSGAIVPVALPDQPARFSRIGSVFDFVEPNIYLALGFVKHYFKRFSRILKV